MGFFSWLFGKSNPGGDGSSAAQAVVVGSVRAEYAWVRRNCPGYSVEMQSLEEIGGKPFDVLRLRNEQGEQRTIYFDISRFY